MALPLKERLSANSYHAERVPATVTGAMSRHASRVEMPHRGHHAAMWFC